MHFASTASGFPKSKQEIVLLHLNSVDIPLFSALVNSAASDNFSTRLRI